MRLSLYRFIINKLLEKFQELASRIIPSFKDNMLTFQRRREHDNTLCFVIVSLVTLSAALIWPTVAWTTFSYKKIRGRKKEHKPNDETQEVFVDECLVPQYVFL